MSKRSTLPVALIQEINHGHADDNLTVIEARVEEVVANVRRHAMARGLPPDKIEKLWRKLIDWSIAREEDRLGRDDR